MSDDLRFEFGGAPLWRKGGKQVLQGTDFIKMESNHHMYDRPLKLNWQFKSPLPLIFDWNSRFCVEGEFQTRETEADAWQSCTPNESANVMVQPNWWGILVKKLELFDCGGSLVHQHNEPFHVRNHLEQFLYWGMDPVLKKQLCSEESHPGYSIPNKKGDWTFNTSETASSWQKYSKSIFVSGPIKFHWNALFFFPFYQGSNHMYDQNRQPRCLPTPYSGDLRLEMLLQHDTSTIFKKRGEIPAEGEQAAVPGCTKEYRFHLEKVDLICEQARLNPMIEKKLFKSTQKVLHYFGVTKNVRAETISANTSRFQSKFENVLMPESVLIYALPRSVTGDLYKFSDWNGTEPFFCKHNINSVSFAYGQMPLSESVPNFGTINDDFADLKRLTEYEKSPPFGLKFAQKRITRANIKNGWGDTDFPHIYVNLCPSGTDSRILVKAESLPPKKQDFTVTMSFPGEGSVPNVSYIVALIYTSTNMQFDLKEKNFFNPNRQI